MFNTNLGGIFGIPTYRFSGQYPSNINFSSFTVPAIAEKPNATGFDNSLFFDSFLKTVDQSNALAPVTKNTFGTPLNKKAPFNVGSFYGKTPSVNSQTSPLSFEERLFDFYTQQRKDQQQQQADYIKALPGLMETQARIQEQYASRAADKKLKRDMLMANKKFNRDMLMGGANALFGGLQTYIQGGDPSILMYRAEAPMRIAGGLMQGYQAGLR
jgi:hypothetical protein